MTRDGHNLVQCSNAMPLFYFDTFDGCSWVIDRIGLELASATVARREAIKVLPEMVGDLPDLEFPSNSPAVTIRDAAGRVLFAARLSLEMVDPY